MIGPVSLLSPVFDDPYQFHGFIAGGKAPIAILGAEIDQMSPPALLKQFEEILSSKPEVSCFITATQQCNLITFI